MNKTYSTIETPNTAQRFNLVHTYKPTPHFKTTTAIYRNLTKKPSHFMELSLFKQQLKNNIPRALTYNEYSSKVRLYRTIFFSLAILFICLGAVIFYQNIAFSHLLFGELRILIRNCISTFAVSIGLVAAALGCSLSIVKEATENLAGKARRKLTRIYTRKRIEYGIKNFFLWTRASEKATLLRMARLEMHEKINEKKTETAELLREICKSNGFDNASHELLFSQALAEMNEQVKQHLQNFKELKL